MLATLLFAAAVPMTTVPAATRLDLHNRNIAEMRLSVIDCSGKDEAACREVERSPYRLARNDGVDPTSKDRAFAETGTRCGLMGPGICPSGTHTILRAGEDPEDTIAESFGRKKVNY